MTFIAAFRAGFPAIRRCFADTAGATAIEYGIIASLLSIVIVGSVHVIGQELLTNFYNKLLNMF